MDVRARMVLMHEDAGLQEWGVGAVVSYDPGAKGRGAMVQVVPRWGTVASGVDRLWSDGAPAAQRDPAAASLAAEMSYGGLGLTPFLSAELADGGYRVGAGGRVRTDVLDLEVRADRDASGAGSVRQGLRLQGSMRF